MIKEGNRASLIVARCRELLYEANDTYLIAWYKHHSEISQQVPRIWKWLGDKGWGDIGISEVLRRSVRCGCGSDYYRFDFILNKYMWIRTEFGIQLKNHLGTWPINVNVMPHAEQILYQLKVARKALQYSSSSDLDRASLALELAAASMIWVCPPSRLCSMITKEVSRLQNSTITEKEQYLQDLKGVKDRLKFCSNWDPRNLNQYYIMLEDIDECLNKEENEKQRNDIVQIARLKKFRDLGVIVLPILIVASPFASGPEAQQFWVKREFLILTLLILQCLSFMQLWVLPLIMALLGATGGFISGLYQARRSGITLADFQENKIRLFLKILLGAQIAVIMFIFLSWKMVPGNENSNFGFWPIVALISGFSDRFFLQLLEFRGSNDAHTEASGTADKAVSRGKPESVT